MVSVCTHLAVCRSASKVITMDGSVPGHGSHYDAAVRIRKDPAPQTLAVPKYEYISDKKIRIGRRKTAARP